MFNKEGAHDLYFIKEKTHHIAGGVYGGNTPALIKHTILIAELKRHTLLLRKKNKGLLPYFLL